MARVISRTAASVPARPVTADNADTTSRRPLTAAFRLRDADAAASFATVPAEAAETSLTQLDGTVGEMRRLSSQVTSVLGAIDTIASQTRALDFLRDGSGACAQVSTTCVRAWPASRAQPRRSCRWPAVRAVWPTRSVPACARSGSW